MSVADSTALRWFLTVFRGQWVEVMDSEADFPDVLADSREWLQVFLAARLNPGQPGLSVRRKAFLGVGTAPDRLIAVVEAPSQTLTLTETLQLVIVAWDSVGWKSIRTRGDALAKCAADLPEILSGAAWNAVAGVLETAQGQEGPPDLNGEDPIMLATSPIMVNEIRSWQDKVSLIWFEEQGYANFCKTYPTAAVAIFKPGQDWYPAAVRERIGVMR